MTALTANLAPSLELMAEIVRRPAFDPGEVARIKDQRLAEIAHMIFDAAKHWVVIFIELDDMHISSRQA